MEKAKPSKKKAYFKNRKPETNPVNTKYVDWKKVRPGVTYDANQSKAPEEKLTLSKRPLQQPESRLAELDEIWKETHVGENFETLVNVPLSAGSHFVLKAEKNWTMDASKYDEFFAVDVENLATIIECIPYNQFVDVDNKYFTRDELTLINNDAEQAKKNYDVMLESLGKDKIESSAMDRDPSSSGRTKTDSLSEEPEQSDRTKSQQESNPLSIEEDLDFLLSLKEPVRSSISVAPSLKSNNEESKTKNIPAATKSIDLEKWLDLVLDD